MYILYVVLIEYLCYAIKKRGNKDDKTRKTIFLLILMILFCSCTNPKNNIEIYEQYDTSKINFTDISYDNSLIDFFTIINDEKIAILLQDENLNNKFIIYENGIIIYEKELSCIYMNLLYNNNT